MNATLLVTTTGIEGAFLSDLLVILGAAAIVAVLLQRIHLAAIAGYLITGAVIGPSALGLVASPERLEDISHLAIILLMFGIGLHLHLSVFRRGLSRMVLAGAASCFFSLLVGWPIASAFGLSLPAALAVAMASSLSSTAVVMRIITAKRQIHHLSGRMSLSILVVQDLAVLGMLALLPSLARWNGLDTEAPLTSAISIQGASGWLHFAVDEVIRFGSVLAFIVLGKILLPRILDEALKGRSMEVLMIVSVAAALTAAFAAQTVGFSLEMGAFLAGYLLAGTHFRHHLSGQIGPLRDIFIAVFFTTVGMKLDPHALAQSWWIIVIGAVVLIATKAFVIAGVCWSLGVTASTGIAIGLALAQAGEFSLILLDNAHGYGVLSAQTLANTMAIVVISLILTPGLIELGKRFGWIDRYLGHPPWLRSAGLRPSRSVNGESRSTDGGDARSPGHVIIGGYGPIGRRIAEELDIAGISFTVLELNPETVRRESRRGLSIVFGDISDRAVLESVGLQHAEALILTIPDDEAVARACAVARQQSPDLFIAARTGVISGAALVEQLGADHVTVDEKATAEAMLAAVMSPLDLREAGNCKVEG